MMDATQRERMAGRFGGSSFGKFPKYEVPILKMDGNTGTFEVREDGEKATLAKAPTIVVLKVRNALAKDINGESYFTSEYESPNDQVSLFKSVAGSTVHVADGTVTEMRASHTFLKMKAVLYVLYDKRVHKLEVKGGSIGNWFDYLTKLKDQDVHCFEVMTTLGTEEKLNESVHKKYFAITFEDKEFPAKADLTAVENAQVEVVEALKKIDDYRNSRTNGAQSSQSLEGFVAEAEAAKGVAYPDEEIDPEDIPF